MESENKKYILEPIIRVVFILTVILWVIFILYTRHSPLYEGPIFQYILKPFLIGMTILPILGAILGFQKAKIWGSWHSAIGKSLNTLSLGLLSWGMGMVVWNYYLFFSNVEVPYPSLGDLFYIMIWLLCTYSMVQMSRATGARFGFKKTSGKLLAFLFAVLAVVVSYYFLFVIARQGSIDLSGGIPSFLLAILYPLGDVAILLSTVLIFVLSYKFLGGKYRVPILVLLVGFILNYIGDVIFVFTTTTGAYFNGHISDLIYVLMIFVLSLGISMMDYKRLSEVKEIGPK